MNIPLPKLLSGHKLIAGLITLTAILGVTTMSVRADAGDQFYSQTVADGLTVPVAMQFAPNGDIYVAEKFGDIKIVRAGGQTQTFGKLAVNGDFEQGLLGMILDPQFAVNGYIYVAYTRPDGDFNRVSRVTADPNNRSVMLPGSEKVLVDNIPSPTGIHQMGELQIGRDNKLYIPAGDGAIDSTTSSRLDTLSGKMLRLNLDGSVPADNPFVGLAGVRPEIWAYGLRNPFTSGMQPSTGKIYVNDVGRDTWEEVNELIKGANYGFPVCEGRCQPARAGYTDPVFQYGHYDGLAPVTGRSITGGAWYEAAVYPTEYRGYYIADYVAGWVKRINADGTALDITAGLPGVVNLKVGPDGLLYTVQLDVNTGSGTIKRLIYGQPPQAQGTTLKVFAAGTAAANVYPTMEVLVDDKVVATYQNVQGNPYARQFTEYNYNHPTALTAGQVKVRFINDYTDASGDRNLYVDRIELNGQIIQTEAASTLSTGSWNAATDCNPGYKASEELACGGYFQYGETNQAGGSIGAKPAATITTPVAETHYSAGNTIQFSGNATDTEDGTLPAGKLNWNVVFHHDTHSHPFLNFNGVDSGTFTIPDAGETAANVFYRISLTAADSAGNTTTTSRDIFPNNIKLGLETNIAGLSLTLDGQPRQLPLSIDAVSGMKRSLDAPASQTVDGKIYDFVSWSDGGAASHTITTLATSMVYKAIYQQRNTAGSTGTTIVIRAAGSPAAGVYPSIQLQLKGITVATFDNIRGMYGTRQFVEYTYNAPDTVTANDVRLVYTNDYMTATEDRNLYVDNISLNGTVYETENPSTLSTGTWTAATGCAPGNKQSEELACGGYLQFADTTPATSGSTITIYAAGSPAAGIYPTMTLQASGTVVASYTDIRGNYNTRQFTAYTYTSPTKLAINQLQLNFTNDAIVNNEDRNLYIDRIILDGTTYQAEDATTLSLGSWDAAGGCNAGYKSSEVLSCGGYFRFGN